MTGTTLDYDLRSGMRLLNDQQLFERMAERTASEYNLTRALAGRAVDQAILVVHATGRHRGLGLSAPLLISRAWRTFITYTRPYFAFCDQYAGGYVHYEPNDYPDGPRLMADGSRPLTPAETAEVMRGAGYWVEPELWTDPIIPGSGHPGGQEGRCV